MEDRERPTTINTDEAGCHARAIRELTCEGEMPPDTRHRQVDYLGKRVEAEHGRLERVIRPTPGFGTMKTAYATLKGFEIVRASKKGQAALWQYRGGIAGEARLVERTFGLGPSGMADSMQRLGTHMREATA